MNTFWTLGHKTELEEMLAGRERRANTQRQMLMFCPGATLICFTLNIAGPMKVTALTDEAFYEGVSAIEEALTMAGISAESETCEHPYGHEAYYVIENENAESVKRLMVMIEEEHPLGRLFDIDVLQSNDAELHSNANSEAQSGEELHKLSRADIGENERRCLICDEMAAVCASARAHSVSELQEKTTQMISDFLRDRGPTAGLISRMAYNSMLNEVATTPKPGLVDFANNGSHKDMTPDTFEKSAYAICDYFGDLFDMGFSNASEPEENLLAKSRPVGKAMENKMLDATEGVNTHKGIIFSLGLICLAWGYLEGQAYQGKASRDDLTISNILKTASKIATPVKDEPNERGGGAREEALSGFKSITEIAIPAYDWAIEKKLDVNLCGVYSIMKLIGELEDTNMVARGGKDLAREMKEKARRITAEFDGKDADDFIKKVCLLEEEFIKNNLSPGGSADLLVITIFLKMLEDILPGPSPA